MNYQKQYQEKLISPKKAASFVESGDWLDYGWGVAHSQDFDQALAERMEELYDVKVRGGVEMWIPEILKKDPKGEHFTWNSWHVGGPIRKYINERISSPATTRVSLLASAIAFPASRAAMVGRKPAYPTSAVSTISIGSIRTICAMASAPAHTFTGKSASASFNSR